MPKFMPRPRYMAIIEFDGSAAFPVPADTLEEAEYMATMAALELPDVVRIPVYRWAGAGREYVLLQTLHCESVRAAAA
jgi:hypothetical protein